MSAPITAAPGCGVWRTIRHGIGLPSGLSLFCMEALSYVARTGRGACRSGGASVTLRLQRGRRGRQWPWQTAVSVLAALVLVLGLPIARRAVYQRLQLGRSGRPDHRDTRWLFTRIAEWPAGLEQDRAVDHLIADTALRPSPLAWRTTPSFGSKALARLERCGQRFVRGSDHLGLARERDLVETAAQNGGRSPVAFAQRTSRAEWDSPRPSRPFGRGLVMSISPDRGDGAVMAYMGIRISRRSDVHLL